MSLLAICLLACVPLADWDSKRLCETHDQWLKKKTVRVTYGLMDPPSDEYVEAREKQFPHSTLSVNRGCVVNHLVKWARVRSCTACDRAEQAWLADDAARTEQESAVDQSIRAHFEHMEFDYPIHVTPIDSGPPTLVNVSEFGSRSAPELAPQLQSLWSSFLDLDLEKFTRENCPDSTAVSFSEPILMQSPQKDISLAVHVRCFKNHRTYFKDKFDAEGEFWFARNIALFREATDHAIEFQGWHY